jgi:uncharacterized membrane protein
MNRWLKHLLYPDWLSRRAFPKKTLSAIEVAVQAAEAGHHGELRFVVEGSLDLRWLMRGVTARQRAIALFGELGVWDTEGNSGVLIYVQLVDHQVEIVADRGIAGKVDQGTWEAVCREMEAAFRAGHFEQGALAGIAATGRILQKHFPALGRNPDELDNAPRLI